MIFWIFFFGLQGAFAQNPPQPQVSPQLPPKVAPPSAPKASPSAPPPAEMPAELLKEPGANSAPPDLIENATKNPIFKEDYVYDPTGRRDPFAPHKSFLKEVPSNKTNTSTTIGSVESLDPLIRMDLDKVDVIGIIWEVAAPRAMIVDKGDPNHTVRVIYKRTKIGRNNGYVSAIREGEVVVVESFEEEGIVNRVPRVLALAKEQK